MSWLSSWLAFVKVVETGSMVEASRRLDCTRAQVSKQIGDLERRFGVRLFERSTRKVSLTPSGEVFYQYALRTLESIEATEVAVRNLGDEPRGMLRVSATVVFGRLYVAPLIPGLIARYPDLECELILGDQTVDLVDDRIDLAIRMTRDPPQDAVVRRLIAVKRVICASPAYIEAHGEPRTPGELERHQCFSYLLTDDNVWRLADRQGKETDIRVRNRFQFNDIACLHDAARNGHGLAILPLYICGADLASGALKVVLEDFEPVVSFGRDIYACYTPSRVRAPKVAVFLAELDRMLSPAPQWAR
ncbi:MAG: LysR family transcriptional regulator [Betaproteobacteria bacterium]|nr:LysR family transcriptional regulator [Betaproteobacteria bacterium]